LIWAVVIFPNIYNIWKSERNSSNIPDVSNCTQVWMKLFQLPKW